MLKNLRLWLPGVMLAGLISAGCFLVSGQFIVTFDFASHGFDPLVVASPTTLAGVPVDLNLISEYKDHKSDLKDVVDLALLGKMTNLTGTATDVEVWMVANPSGILTTDTAVRAAGVRVWGPLTLPANGAVSINWNKSATLFSGRKALISEIKGDGRFDLYAIGSGAYNFRVDKGALVAVISAGK
jgi:hypothetical protein